VSEPIGKGGLGGQDFGEASEFDVVVLGGTPQEVEGLLGGEVAACRGNEAALLDLFRQNETNVHPESTGFEHREAERDRLGGIRLADRQ
jgi:hypothetical protein